MVFVPDATAAVVAPANGSLPEWPKGLPQMDAAGALSLGTRAFVRDWGRSLVFWLPVLALDLAKSFYATAWSAAHAPPGADPFSDLDFTLRFLGLDLPLVLAFAIVSLAWWSGQAAIVRARLTGATPTARGAYQVFRAHALPLLALGATLALLFTAGLVLFVVPFFVFFYWYFFASAARIEPGSTLAGSLATSRAFARERRTMGFMLVVFLIMVGAYAVALVASAIGVSLGGLVAPKYAQYWGEGAGAVVWWLLSPLAPTLAATFYFGVRLGVTPVAANPAPEATFPAAASAPSGSSVELTRCPHCRTIFPYKPGAGGEAVKVECPTCGKAGLIR